MGQLEAEGGAWRAWWAPSLLLALALALAWIVRDGDPAGGRAAVPDPAAVPEESPRDPLDQPRAETITLAQELDPATPESSARRATDVPGLVVNVVDPEGRPVVGATITLGSGAPSVRTSDAQGRAAFSEGSVSRVRRDARDGLPALVAHRDGFGDVSVWLASGVRSITLTLGAPWRARLRVEDAAGEPVTPADVLWRSREIGFDVGASTTPDVSVIERGELLLENLHAGRGLVTVGAPGGGFVTSQLLAGRSTDSGELPRNVVVLHDPHEITIEVVDDRGRPVAGAVVRESGVGRSAGDFGEAHSRVTDAAGCAQFTALLYDVSFMAHSFAATCPGHRPGRVLVPNRDSSEGRGTIVLERAARLEVRLVDEQGRGVPGLAMLQRLATQGLRMRLSGGALGDVIELDDQGRGVFELASANQPIGLRIGTAFASHQYGHIAWAEEIQPLRPGEVREQTVVLRGHRRLELSLADGRGERLDGQLLLLLEGSEDQPAGRWDSYRVDVTSERSSQVWVVPGRYRVSIWPAAWAQSFEAVLDVGDDDLVHEFEVESAGELSGRLVDAQGQPLVGERVEAQLGTRGRAVVATDGWGRFRIRGLDRTVTRLIFDARAEAQQAVELGGVTGELGDVVRPPK